MFFVRAKFFRNKKKDRLEIVLVTLIHYTTDAYPYQPSYREFICTDLFFAQKALHSEGGGGEGEALHSEGGGGGGGGKHCTVRVRQPRVA